MSISPEPDHPDAARAVGALLAPVVACLRGDDEGVRLLLDDTCESGAVGGRRPRPRLRSCACISASHRRPTAPPASCASSRARRSNASAIPSS